MVCVRHDRVFDAWCAEKMCMIRLKIEMDVPECSSCCEICCRTSLLWNHCADLGQPVGDRPHAGSACFYRRTLAIVQCKARRGKEANIFCFAPIVRSIVFAKSMVGCTIIMDSQRSRNAEEYHQTPSDRRLRWSAMGTLQVEPLRFTCAHITI